MDRRHYNRDDAYSRGGDRVDRYYEEGGRAGYGGDRYYESSQEGGRGGYGGDRYYEGSQEGGRAGYGGDRYYESSQEGGRAGYGGGDRYYRGEQDGGGRGVYGGDGGGRGGYGGDGGGRGGYGGDRYYGGAQDGGGRGGYGGGTGAGYHRRSVGRDRSYTHPYNNRHQEDQGGGRRRESGGGGGGSPSYRTPTYHRQISDQVQDRLGRHPEAIRSRSPVRVQDRLGRNPDAIRSPLRVQDRLEAVRSRSPLRVLDRLGRNPEAIRSPPRVLNRLGRDPEAIRSRSPLRVQDRLEAVRSRSPLRVPDRLGHNPETIRSPPRVLNRLGRDPEAIRSRSPRVQDRLGRDPEAIRSRSPLRVQDRLGRDPEAIRSPPQFGQLVNSRSRSQSQALTQPQNRIADRIQEVEEVKHREVQCVQSLMEDGEYGYAPMRRPDHGTLAMKSVKLLVNHFPVKFDPSTAILRYDVDIKHEMASSGRSMKKPIPKSDLRLIQEQLCTDDPDRFPIRHTAYDGEKNMYSAVSLPEGTYNVQLHGRSYTCTIKYGTKLGLSKLQDFLKGNSMHIPRDVLQALDVVMKANLYREKNSVGKGMYPRVHRKEDDLHGGVAAYRGSQQSLKVTSNGLVMCLDYSAVPFRKRMPVFDFLKECIQGIREVYDIERFGNQVIRALKGLKVGVTHRRTNQKYTVCGLSEKPTRDISFELEDLEGKKETEVIMLTDYFREKWGKDIKHKDMPCLNLGNNKKPNYVPMEFCILAEDKRFPKEQLGKEAARKLKELSLLNPNCREREIHTMVHEEYATGKNGAKLIKNFEVEVGMNMTEVDGRVMAPPQLKLGSLNGKTMTTTVDRMKCHWNLLQGKTLVVGKSAERWAVIDFTRDDRRNSLNVNYFIGKLMKRCESIGIQMEEPIMVHQTTMREFSDINKLTRLLNEIMDECRRIDNRRLQMIFCVMAEKHDGYKYLKWVSETQLGIITQCCLSFNANKANDQFLANLGMKINAKLGGSNVELIERFPLFNSSDHFMFIGADVNHPTGSNQSSPSVAAVVGSVNWPAATRYAARVSPQQHRKEEIVNFGSLCLDLVNTYELRNGIKPNRIVVFRDGVSDGQFDMVLNKEMVDMKKALYDDHYRPAVTFVVAQKRHTTRLFLNNGNGVGNIPPGTVVDTTIVQPFEFDFYLCSHFGGMGTSKPTHYSVIWDENGFTSDEMQKLIYHLCFIFARCTKPVSLVPPVYYADLVAYRGRMFQEVAAESELESGMSASEPSSFDRFFYNLEDHLRDSMFFI